MIDNLDFYAIEDRFTHWGTEYRFRSYYNNAVGTWLTQKEAARNAGERHKALILAIHCRDLSGEVAE